MSVNKLICWDEIIKLEPSTLRNYFKWKLNLFYLNNKIHLDLIPKNKFICNLQSFSKQIEMADYNFNLSDSNDVLSQFVDNFNINKNNILQSWFKAGETLQKYINIKAENKDISKFWINAYLLLIGSQFIREDVLNQICLDDCSQVRKALLLENENIFNSYIKYPHLLELFAEYSAHTNALDNIKLISEINPYGDILDLGAGNGSFLSLLSKNSNFLSLQCFDHLHSKTVLELSKIRWDRNSILNWSYGDFFNDEEDFSLNLKDKKFDFIFLNWIMHDWDDSKGSIILSKITKYLKPHGKLVILEKLNNTNGVNQLYSQLVLQLIQQGYERSTDDYLDLLKSNNFFPIQISINEKGRGFIIAEYKK